VGAVHRSKRPKLAARPGGMSPKLKPVLKLLNELLRHQYVGPFAAPVDPRIYPSYYEGPRAVADPIDLGSIKKNLEAGAYANADAVKTDVDRVWANCRQYNGEESEIARMAETLEGLFDEKMATIPQELEAEEEASRRRDDQRKDKRERDLLKQMQDMQRQMMEMQKQQLAMQQQGMAAVPPGGGGRGSKRPRPPNRAMVEAKEAPIDLSRDMTYEEKTQLSAGINKLKSDNLGRVVSIIRENMPSLGNGTDEIEVDFNALDRKTLWELHRFVNACLKKKPTKKAAQHTTASRMLGAQQAKAQTEQRIAQLQQSLQASHGAASSGGGGGISLARQDTDDFGGNDSPSDSDSDGGGSPGGGGGYYEQFAQSKAQSDREQQESERRRQDAEREAAAKRRQKEEHEKARIERERAAARAANEDGDGIDMLGQSNMMASFADGSGTFDFSGLDEYGDD